MYFTRINNNPTDIFQKEMHGDKMVVGAIGFCVVKIDSSDEAIALVLRILVTG